MTGVGDVITTAEELDALPHRAVVLDIHGAPALHDTEFYLPEESWFRTGSGLGWGSTEIDLPAKVVFLPGHPPRPERVVKAEALREAYDRSSRGPDAMPLKIWIAAAGWLQRRADRIEAGDLP